MKKRLFRNEKGFTMVEMMVVLIIIAVLIGVGIRFYLGYIENSRVTKAKSQIMMMQAAMDSYHAEKGGYITTANPCTLGAFPALSTLGISTDAKDPWGRDYYIKSTKVTTYAIYTGYNKVQGKSDNVVIGTGEDGKSASPEISTISTS